MQDSVSHQESQADIYKRIKVLGSGSYGRAFLVLDKQNGQEWVIKQINLADMSNDEQEAALKEAKILQMLNHPNIVRFREVYRTAKMKLNIVMEYAGGGDLGQRIKAAKEAKVHFSEHQILEWFVQICLAVRYIHSNKIIHRDLKAQNVFLTEGGLVKLGDFGVAKVLEHTAGKARTVVGSPYYLSPEIIENRPYSLKTDIWSLGALLYEMCALQPPFKANNIQFLALKIVQGAPPPLPKMYSEGLRSLVRFMLQTKESSRPTIHQIFSQKIIIDTIRRLNGNEMMNPAPAPTPVVHTISNFSKVSTLKPPPNLLLVEALQNKSDIVQSKNMVQEDGVYNEKSQTPQTNSKKGPNNFFHRPMSSKRKMSANSADVDLAGLIQIKPSVIEKHQKPERPLIPLPPFPKVSPTKKSPPIPTKSAVEMKRVEKKEIVSPPLTAFTKKRSSFAQCEAQKKEVPKAEEIRVGKVFQKKLQVGIAKKEKEVKKPQIRKKTYVPTKKEGGEMKLEVCSQQMKKKQPLQKKIQKKKVEKVTSKRSDKPEKKKKGALVLQAREEPVMEEEKCNSEEATTNKESDDYFSNYYDDEDFETYSSESEEEVDLAFSITNDHLNFNFHKMMEELAKIQKIVQAGGNIEQTDDLGQSIPQLINFSAEIREDDNQLDSNPSSRVLKDTDSEPQQVDFRCLETHAELQLLRMKLEELFGVENIIFAYQVIEEKLEKEGLNFCQDEVISEIVAKRGEINEKELRRCFGHIVAIISRQKNLV